MLDSLARIAELLTPFDGETVAEAFERLGHLVKLQKALLDLQTADKHDADPLNDPFTDAFVAHFGLPALPRIVRGGVPAMAGGAVGP